MIIRREFVPFRTLINNGDKGGELFIKLCKESYPANMREKTFLMLSDFALYQRDMGWAFRKIGDLIAGFRKLDQEEPYETGYDLEDAHTADVLWVDEDTMALLLRCGKENDSAIVGMIEVNATQK